MRIESLGHVVIKVRDLETAEQFYNKLLGIPIQAKSEADQMIFFTLGQHHDFAVIAIGAEAGPDKRSDHSDRQRLVDRRR